MPSTVEDVPSDQNEGETPRHLQWPFYGAAHPDTQREAVKEYWRSNWPADEPSDNCITTPHVIRPGLRDYYPAAARLEAAIVEAEATLASIPYALAALEYPT